MQRAALAALLCLSLIGTTASARVAAPPSIPQRLAAVDCVVVGKVTAIEDKTVTTPDKVEYKIAVVEVKDLIHGAKGLTHVKVGFIPNPGLRRFPHLNLGVGQEALFCLTQHPQGAFYITPMYWDVANKENPDFAQQVAQARRYAKLLDDPEAGLKSRDASERLLTAAMLIVRYRTPRQGADKTEPIDAAQSKLILTALAEADWTKNDPQLGNQLTTPSLFYRLGLTEKDGWTPPKDPQKLQADAQKWLKDHAGTYRIQRFVVEKK